MMDTGDLDGGLNALDVPRLRKTKDGRQDGLIVDGQPVVSIASDPYLWDDLRFPAQGINPAGAVNAPTVDQNNFPGTLLFSVSAVNLVAGVAQMPHTWVPGTDVHPHIHWAKSNNIAGEIAWEWCYSVAGVGEVFPAYSAWEPCSNPVSHQNTMSLHTISAWAPLILSGKKESVVILWQVRRNTDSVLDTYNGQGRLFEFDIHYRRSKLGSVSEFPI